VRGGREREWKERRPVHYIRSTTLKRNSKIASMVGRDERKIKRREKYDDVMMAVQWKLFKWQY